ncbi:33 kDa ribonucleoprotein, chloroplastic [Mercurialis annua]|uniref:33 kDa ribonucleoprotein, chloroplastic n=1 Tax=Mercurialis annua TaxID=3986 RepID=UPI0024AF0B9D|nr:33 kDa ribonucleoprotein, chloroplastic [Mercurialis annua]
MLAPLPMARSAVSSSSSTLYTKLSNFSLTPSPFSLTAHYSSKPFKPIKLFKPNSNHNHPPSLLKFNHQFIPKFSAFDTFEEDPDDHISNARDDLQSDPEEYDQEFQNETKPTELDDGGRLYVGNLPYTMTSSELSEVFQEAGRVANVEIIYDRVTDRSRGFGFVTMASVEEAKEAIKKFNGAQLGGRTVRVNFPEVPKGGEKEIIGTRIRTYKGFVDSPHKIYAGNLGWRVTSLALKDAFANQPGVLSAKVIYERDTGRSRGFGFVSFESAEDADAALNTMNGVELEDRPLRLNMAADRARSTPSTEAYAGDNLETSELFSGIGS